MGSHIVSFFGKTVALLVGEFRLLPKQAPGDHQVQLAHAE